MLKVGIIVCLLLASFSYISSQNSNKAEAKDPKCHRSDPSGIEQNFCDQCLDKLEEQIQEELKAHYTYMYMADYFQRFDVALEGFHNYFLKLSEEEHGHATKLMEYLNKRGVVFSLRKLPNPPSVLELATRPTLRAMEEAIRLEKAVNEKLIEIRKMAQTCKDYDMQEFLDKEYLAEQVDSIKELADHRTNLLRFDFSSEGLGDYLYDEKLKKSSKIHNPIN